MSAAKELLWPLLYVAAKTDGTMAETRARVGDAHAALLAKLAASREGT